MAFSRLYLYVHWPSDVLGGAVLGAAVGWAGALAGSAGGTGFGPPPRLKTFGNAALLVHPALYFYKEKKKRLEMIFPASF